MSASKAKASPKGAGDKNRSGVSRRPVRGSETGRPIMVLLDVLGQRWSLRILWELRDGRQSFRLLRARCDDISPSVLNARLKALRSLELVDLAPDGYGYTPHGEALAKRLVSLDLWANDWAREIGL